MSFVNEELGSFCAKCGAAHAKAGVAFQKTPAGRDMVENYR